MDIDLVLRLEQKIDQLLARQRAVESERVRLVAENKALAAEQERIGAELDRILAKLDRLEREIP